MTAEHLKPLLEDERGLELLGTAACQYATAAVPEEVSRALALARLTALKKGSVGVRGIATEDVFRRLVSRALAQQFAKQFNDATAPHQYSPDPSRHGLPSCFASARSQSWTRKLLRHAWMALVLTTACTVPSS